MRKVACGAAEVVPFVRVTNLARTLAAAGASLEDVVQTTVYLRDLSDFHAMREVFRNQFEPGAYPTRMTATSDFLEPKCKVMIVAVAYKPKE